MATSIFQTGNYEVVRKATGRVNFLKSRKGNSRNYRYAGETPNVVEILRSGVVWYTLTQDATGGPVQMRNHNNGAIFTKQGDIEEVAVNHVYDTLAYEHFQMQAEAI